MKFLLKLTLAFWFIFYSNEAQEIEGFYNFPNSNISISDCIKVGENYLFGSFGGTLYINKNENWENIGGLGSGLVAFEIFNSNLYAVTNSGILISSDNGFSWLRIFKDFIKTSSVSFNNNSILCTTYSNGIFLSENNGNSWSNIGFNNYPISSSILFGDTIFVGSRWGYLYKSVDKGKIFEKFSNFQEILKLRLINNKVFVFSSNGFYYSNDFGNTWSDELLSGYNCKDIKFQYNSYFVSTEQGYLFYSNDLKEWKKIENELFNKNYGISSFMMSDSNIFVCTFGGIYKSKNFGQEWIECKFHPRSVIELCDLEHKLLILPNNADKLFEFDINSKNIFEYNYKFNDNSTIDHIITDNNVIVFWQTDSLIISDDFGGTFNSFYNINKLVIHSVYIFNKKIYTCDSKGFSFTENNGSSWKRLNIPISSSNTSYLSDSLFIVCSFHQGIFSSFDEGITWIYNNFKDTIANSIVVDSNIWYVGVGNVYNDSLEKGIFFTTNRGEIWSKCSDVNYIIQKLIVYNGVVFAGTYGNGLYMTEDKGVSWKFVGLSNYAIFDMLFNDEYLYLGTNYGLFRVKISDLISVGEKENIFELVNIFPNPTENKISLSEIPEGAYSYEIFDNLGIKVSEGLIKKDIDVSFLSSGIYFLKLNNQKPIKFIKLQ